MKNLYTIFILCISLTSFAQPVLNSSEMLPFGYVMHLNSITDLSVIDTTLDGPNQTWDFSALSGTTYLDVAIVDPASTPQGLLFPNSNYAYAESPTVAYRYFNLNSTKMERVGSYSTTVSTFTDPQIEYVFPLQLGSTNHDTWASTSSSFGGTYDLSCVGTGTLILPGGSFEALMVRVDFTELSSFQVYFWYDADNGAMLLERVFGDGIFVPDLGLYLESLGNGIDEKLISNIKFNNPVVDNLHLSYSAPNENNLKYTITNFLGQVMQRNNLNSSATYAEIDFSFLPDGIYFIDISSVNRRGNRMKIIKQSN